MIVDPTLVHVERDPVLKWQWWAAGPTRGFVDLAGPQGRDRTYIAGFRDKAGARAYAALNGWPIPPELLESPVDGG